MLISFKVRQQRHIQPCYEAFCWNVTGLLLQMQKSLFRCKIEVDMSNQLFVWGNLQLLFIPPVFVVSIIHLIITCMCNLSLVSDTVPHSSLSNFTQVISLDWEIHTSRVWIESGRFLRWLLPTASSDQQVCLRRRGKRAGISAVSQPGLRTAPS